jgi:hypothetical protein
VPICLRHHLFFRTDVGAHQKDVPPICSKRMA